MRSNNQPQARPNALVQVKAGAAATTGSQVTPTVDAGFTAMFVVTVAYGQTTITSRSCELIQATPPSRVITSSGIDQTSNSISPE